MSNKVKAVTLIAIGAFVIGLAVGQFVIFSVFDVHYKTIPETPPVEFCDPARCLVVTVSSAQNWEV